MINRNKTKINELLYEIKSYLKNVDPITQKYHAEEIIALCHRVVDNKE